MVEMVKIILGGKYIEKVKDFQYLISIINEDLQCGRRIKTKISVARKPSVEKQNSCVGPQIRK